MTMTRRPNAPLVALLLLPLILRAAAFAPRRVRRRFRPVPRASSSSPPPSRRPRPGPATVAPPLLPLLPLPPLGSSSPGSGGDDDDGDPSLLRIAVAGAGPSGLLLAHALLRSPYLPLGRVDVFELRSDPRSLSDEASAGRAYALGLGARGRAAIRSVDDRLWEAVKGRGRECERFRLHLTPKLGVTLRDGEEGVEPSVLIYQTDLCGALLDELEKKAAEEDGARAKVRFDANITRVDLSTSTLTLDREGEGATTTEGPYDLIVGCDGANSAVRDAFLECSPPDTFRFDRRKLLPGCFKVARATGMPPLLDARSVGLVLPKSAKGGVTAFVEPTRGGGACVLFAGRLGGANENEHETKAATKAENDEEEAEASDLSSILFPPLASEVRAASDDDVASLSRLLLDQFPLLEGTPDLDDMARELLVQRSSVASAVRCNAYHSPPDGTPAALCGDAAHATGGVSGQGCNSALVDATALAECLAEEYRPATAGPADEESDDDARSTKRGRLHRGALAYSRRAVPEGRALYDLSFGNDGKTLPIFRTVRARLADVLDALFGGRFGLGTKPLQTLLASTTTSFATIRREREGRYVEDFPTDEEWREEVEGTYRRR
ncbi:hypothetical protein ACHAWF_019029 [Thalassiosira exigua]